MSITGIVGPPEEEVKPRWYREVAVFDFVLDMSGRLCYTCDRDCGVTASKPVEQIAERSVKEKRVSPPPSYGNEPEVVR